MKKLDIKTLHSISPQYSADSIEWCQFPGFKSYFACGTYQLEGDNSLSSSPPCRRKGCIYLFKYDVSSDELKEVHKIETAAILDMKWLQHYSTDIPTLAVADALGSVEVYHLKDEKLIKVESVSLNSNYHNLLTLSLDCSWRKTPTQIVASDSLGDISLVQFTNSELKPLMRWTAHNFEAWICAFDKWDPNRVYTGGDDTLLHVYDIRSPTSASKISTNKSHIAGVTSMLSHPTKENILLTGSYDDRLRAFDTRQMRDCLNEINLKGGIWRIKADPQDKNLLLCACMYHNFSIVKTDDSYKELEIVGEFYEHKSICYGSDWCPTPEKLIMATCSFYDRKLCIAEVNE